MVRTLSGGGIRRISPGVFSLFIVERIGTDVAVVRTISAGAIRLLSPGVFSVFIVISGWIGTGVSIGFGYDISGYIKGLVQSIRVSSSQILNINVENIPAIELICNR